MPYLEITYPDGRSEMRRLSRRSPIVVGRNPISDVHVDDVAVAPIHCRILWNGTHFEVTATSDEGVDVNGVMVQRKRLAAGDTIHIGSADLVVVKSAKAAATSRPGSGGTSSVRSNPPDDSSSDDDVFSSAAPRTEELSLADWDALAGQGEADQTVEPRPRNSKRKQKQAELSEIEEEIEEEEKTPEAVATSSIEASQGEGSAAEPEASAAIDSQAKEETEFNARPVLLDEPEAKKPKEDQKRKGTPAPAAKWDRLRTAKRPGEQDILTSPVVLGLGGLALALLLASAATWLLIGRENADRLYDAAVADRESGRYLQAIGGFERFLLDFPTDSRIPEARVALGLTKIERHSQSASPNFEEALLAFDEFVRNHRDHAGFAELRPTLARTAASIATGATSAAIRTGDRDYLAPAERAAKIFSQFGDQGARDKETRSRLDSEFAKAEAAVRKQEYFSRITQRIEAAIAENQFIDAYEARNDLLARYGDFRDNRQIDELLREALETEKSLVRAEEEIPETSDVGRDTVVERPSLMLMGHTEARLGEVSDGRLAIAVAADQLVGLDVVTGKPVWRTPIGADSPFFPVAVDAAVRSLLVFDASRNDLLLVRRDSGEIVWRAPIGQLASGPPHVAQGQVDLVTTGGRLVRVSLETGELLESIHFPQPLVGSPMVTSDGEHLVVLGEQSTAYVLDLRSLEMRGASYIGHPAGSLAVAPQRLGGLILVFENDQLKRATIRAFTFESEAAALNLVATERVEGTIHTPPMPRGNVMFVASMPERITAFSVSDDRGQPPLTRLAGVQVPNPQPVHTFLVPGPDGMVWAAGSALRKLKLEAGSLKFLPGELAAGQHRQPVQESGESLFVARTLPSSRAIYVSQADREAMTGNWRCVLGASVIAWTGSEAGLRLVTDAGQVATVNAGNLVSGRFLNTTLLPGWDEAGGRLGGANLADGTAIVWQGGKTPRFWRVRPSGNVAAAKTIAGTPQAPPILLGGGMVWPLAGRLEWSPDNGGDAVEPFLLPVTGEDDAPAWRSLVALDEESFAVKSADGKLRVLRRREEPRPHFAEIATATISAKQNLPVTAFEGDLFIAVDQRLEKLDAAGLRPTGEVAFSEMIQGGPWVAGKQVIVRTESGDVVSVDGETLKEKWRLKFESPLADTPQLVNAETNEIRLASQDGTVVVVDASGSEQSRTILPQRLTGLAILSDMPVAVAWSGALVSLGDLSESQTVPADAEDTPNSASAGSTDAPPDAPMEPVVAAKTNENSPMEGSEMGDAAGSNGGER